MILADLTNVFLVYSLASVHVVVSFDYDCGLPLHACVLHTLILYVPLIFVVVV